MFSSVLRHAVPSALLAAVVLISVGPAAADPTRHHQASPTAHAGRGVLDHGLNSRASSCGHDCVAVTAFGFAAAEQVRIRALDRPGWQRLVTADRSGRVRLRWTVTSARPDVVTFVGLGTSATTAPAGSVNVSVPRIAVYRLAARR